MSQPDPFRTSKRPWNAGRVTGPKALLKPKHVWAIRQQLKMMKRADRPAFTSLLNKRFGTMA